MAALLDTSGPADREQRIGQIVGEIDNLRASFAWHQDNDDIERSLQLTSSLQPLWIGRGRLREGLSWFQTAFAECDAQGIELSPAVHVQALADRSVLDAWTVSTLSTDGADQALTIAREIGDPALLVRALAARGFVAAYQKASPGTYLAEAIELARGLGDDSRLSQVLGWGAYAAFLAGDSAAARALGEEGRKLGDAVGDGFTSRFCRNWGLGPASAWQGDIEGATAVLQGTIAESEAAGDPLNKFLGLIHLGHMFAYRGDASASRAAAAAAVDMSADLGSNIKGAAYLTLVIAALAAGDAAAAAEAAEVAWRESRMQPELSAIQLWRRAEAALAQGDLVEARRCADDAVTGTQGWHVMEALASRSRVGIAEGLPEQADRDAHDAIAVAAEIKAQLGLADVFECLGRLAGNYREAARLFGAADALRQRIGVVRLRVHDADVNAAISNARDALGDSDFDAAWTEGAALSTDEAIAYAQRRRGARKRPSTGWASLTPTELDVVRLLSEGLGNKDIGARLFMSPRTVQTHLTHVYTKLGLTSRVQLAQEAARHS